jgi:hypothetical protein
VLLALIEPAESAEICTDVAQEHIDLIVGDADLLFRQELIHRVAAQEA